MRLCITWFAAVWILCFRFCDHTVADDLLPAEQPVATVIDHYVDAANAEGVVVPAAIADDASVLRRTTLDLGGRIPTMAEQKWFAEQPVAERRVLLVERLLNLPDYELHLRNELDSMLLPNEPDQKEFREYLLWALQQKHSWDQMFREMLQPTDSEGPQKGAAKFLQARVNQLDDLTNDTVILFFGVNISCAKCHDHPLVEDWKQDHFYGMQTFFSRTYKTKKNTLAEKLFDEVKFKTTSGEDKKAAYMFLTGEVIEDRTPELSDEARKKADEEIRNAQQKDDASIPVPEFSPRQELVNLALKEHDDHFFAKNIVNRVWARLLGRGLVDPPDQMHTGNPPSHPLLLRWLARDLSTHGYDLKRLISGIVLSKAYARSSTWRGEGKAPGPQTFALGKIQPLTPRQLAASLIVVSQNPEKWPAADASEEWSKRREDIENKTSQWFREFEQPRENFQVAVDEALFFSNNPRLYQDILRDAGDRLVGHLKSQEDDTALVNLLWASVMNRPPYEEERRTAMDWLSRDGDRIAVIRELSWALIAGPEFRFNH